MAKLTYATDSGKSITFVIDENAIATAKELHNVDLLQELFSAMQKEISTMYELEK